MVCAFVNMMGLYTAGWAYIRVAYIWNAESVSNMVGLCTEGPIFGGRAIFGGMHGRRFTVAQQTL